jgi:chromosome segregation ATPase
LPRVVLFAWLSACAGVVACSGKSDKTSGAPDSAQAERAGLIRDRDQFGTAVAEYAGLVNDLDSVLRTPTERKNSRGELVDDKQRRIDILRRARELRHALDSMSARVSTLEQSAQRSQAAQQSSIASIAALRATVSQLNEMSKRQAADIERMSQQYDSLSRVSASNEHNATTYRAALDDVVERQESVYVAVGTASDLARRGIVRKRGGFIGLGSTLVPVLPYRPDLFQAKRMSADTVIEFPDSTSTYRIITGQNPQGARSRSLGHLKGSLAIENPGLFWRDSRFLIVVRQ